MARSATCRCFTAVPLRNASVTPSSRRLLFAPALVPRWMRRVCNAWSRGRKPSGGSAKPAWRAWAWSSTLISVTSGPHDPSRCNVESTGCNRAAPCTFVVRVQQKSGKCRKKTTNSIEAVISFEYKETVNCHESPSQPSRCGARRSPFLTLAWPDHQLEGFAKPLTLRESP